MIGLLGDEGNEKMILDREGSGEKFKPMSLAMMASLYVSWMVSRVGRKMRHG